MITKEQAQRELAFREMSRRRLEYFVQQVDPFYGHEDKGYVFKPFHRIMTDALERVLAKKSKKIMISVPPQHGKSTISTQRFPLFAHLKDPTQYIVSASYSGDLAKTHLSKARQVAESPQFHALGIPLNFDTNGAFEYTLKEGGGYYAVGVGGSLTGRPIDIGIIDDVHKDRLEYESDTIRNNTWDWYTSVFLSRLHKDSVQIGVMTRWGEDDLFGRILALEGDKKDGGEWEVINIPVIQGTDTIFPERFPYDFIQKKRGVMGERDFQALYMGDPINEGGGDFKREYFQYYDSIDHKNLRVYSFLDPAISDKQEADYTAIVTIGIDSNNRIYVLDIIHDRMNPTDIINAVFETNARWQPHSIGIEIVAYQKMLALEIRKQMNLRNIFFNLVETLPMGEKNARIRTLLQPRYGNASIIHPNYHNKTKDLELELLKFPNGKHDDIIDALASCLKISQVQTKSVSMEVSYDDFI